MMVVVDTNVTAYYLLRTKPFVEEAAAFWEQGLAIHAPASWEAELTNVIWMSARSGLIDEEAGREKLRLAGSLGIRSMPVHEIWEGALSRSIAAGHPAYDTLFVELAHRLGVPLVTFDEGMLSKFPDVARRPRDLHVSTRTPTRR